MNNRFVPMAFLFTATFILVHAVLAQPPALINYQGRLTQGTNLVNNSVGLTLRLFNAPSGGTMVYADSNQVAVVDGLYSTFIGDATISGALTTALTNAQVWLEAVVNGTVMSPRERIVSVAYALDADHLDALNSSQFLRSDVTATQSSGGLIIEGTLSVFGTNASDNDMIFFDNSTNEFFRWNNASLRFDLSDDLTIGGTLAVGSLGLGPRAYNRIGPSNTTHALGGSNDLLVTGSLEIDGAIFADGLVQIASGNPGEGKILTSDANGVARWADNPIKLFGLDFSPFVPEVIDNSVQMEISGITGLFTGLVINGPGYAIERIFGFTSLGKPEDQSGLNVELPIVFDTDSTWTNGLNTWYKNFTNGILDYRAMSMIVRTIGGTETYRVNSFELYPAAVSTGLAGRTRYTLLNRFPPNMQAHVERDPTGFGTASSFNTNMDARIEISGISHGPYPAVVITASNRTLTLTFDYGEGGAILGWVRDIATLGTLNAGKRSMSVIYESFNGTNFVEVARTNFFGIFPIHHQSLSLGQDIKSKERVILSYDFEEDAGP